jgi:hypothetical protein
MGNIVGYQKKEKIATIKSVREIIEGMVAK